MQDAAKNQAGQDEVFERCQAALRDLETCQEREVKEYGEEGYQEVKEMESEAPAPSPCVDRYNAVVEALLEYEGSLDDFELGRFHKSLHASVKARRA